MMSLSSGVSASGATSYFEKEDYYLKGNESSEWLGKTADSLGLEGPVQKADFAAVCRGADPMTGETLVRSKAGKDGAEEHRAGNDLTFTAPKSVSVGFAAGVEGLKEAHDAAVKSVVSSVLEPGYSQFKEKGQLVNGENLLAAKIDHATNRNLDPNLHSHVFLMNMVQTPDGKFKANDPQNVYRDQKQLGLAYRQELAHELRERGFQVEITDKTQMFFEIRGVDEKTISAFSSRREQVENKVKEMQESGKYQHLTRAELYEKANLTTRESKKAGISKEEVKKEWATTFEKAGTSAEAVKSSIENTVQIGQGKEERTAAQVVGQAVSLLLDKEASLDQAKVLTQAIKISGGNHSLKEIQTAVKENTVQIGQEKGRSYLSTPEMMELEKSNLAKAEKMAGSFQSVTSKQEVEAFLDKLKSQEKINLNDGQRAFVTNELTGKNGVNICQGDPGTGKTFVSKIVERFNDEILKPSGRGHEVVNLAFTGKAAHEMSAASGKVAYTVHSFLNAVQSGKINFTSQEKAATAHKSAIAAENRTVSAAERQFSTIGGYGNSYNGGKMELGASAGGLALRQTQTEKTLNGGVSGRSATKSGNIFSGINHHDRQFSSHGGFILKEQVAKGTVKMADGRQMKYEEKSLKSGLFGYTSTTRKERTGDSLKITKSKTFGGRTTGTTKTIKADGSIQETRWEGRQLAGQFHVTNSESRSYVDHRAAAELSHSALYKTAVAMGFLNPDKAARATPIEASIGVCQHLEKSPGGPSVNIPKTSQVVLKVDEASFLGAKQAGELLKIVENLQKQGVQAKIEFVGDTKQKQSIAAGATFRQFQELAESGKVDLSKMKDIVRQKDPGLRDIAKLLNKDSGHAKNAVAALSKLEERGAVLVTKDVKAAAVGLYRERAAQLSRHEDKASRGELASTLLVVPTNKLRQELNQEIRGERVAAGEIQQGQRFETLSSANAATAADYQAGQRFEYHGGEGGEQLQKFTSGEVTGADVEKNTLNVKYEFEKGGKAYGVNKTLGVCRTLPT